MTQKDYYQNKNRKPKPISIKDLPYEIQKRMYFSPTPSYTFQNGEEVWYSDGYDAYVIQNYNESAYEIMYSEGKIKDGKLTITKKGLQKWVLWYDIRPINDSETRMFENQEPLPPPIPRKIKYVLDLALYHGLDFEAPYRNNNLWTLQKKKLYIASIFENIELGTFRLIINIHGPFMYECVDGTERLKAIKEYYTNTFPCKGRYFSDLSDEEKMFFLNKELKIIDLNHKLQSEEKANQYEIANRERLGNIKKRYL